MNTDTAIRLTELDDEGQPVVVGHAEDGTPIHNTLMLHSAVQPGLVGRLVVLPAQLDPESGRLVPRPTPQLNALMTAAGAEVAEDADGQDAEPAGEGVMYGELLLTLDLASVAWLLALRSRSGQASVEVWAVPPGLGDALDPTPWSYSTVRWLNVRSLFVTVAGQAMPDAALPEIDDGVVGMTQADRFTARRLTVTPPPRPS